MIQIILPQKVKLLLFYIELCYHIVEEILINLFEMNVLNLI